MKRRAKPSVKPSVRMLRLPEVEPPSRKPPPKTIRVFVVVAAHWDTGRRKWHTYARGSTNLSDQAARVAEATKAEHVVYGVAEVIIPRPKTRKR